MVMAQAATRRGRAELKPSSSVSAPCDEDSHPAIDDVMADDVRDRAVGIAPLELPPVGRVDGDRGEDRVRGWQPESIGTDVIDRRLNAAKLA
jgi:hypothetical protein